MKSLFASLFASFLCLSNAQAELKFVIEPRGSTAETRQQFSPLATYLARELGEQVTLAIAEDFSDYGRILAAGNFDITFAAPATILYNMALTGSHLAGVAIDGDSGASLRGVYLVPKDSPIETLAQLKGKSIAFVARSSQGYIVQSHMLRQAGVDPENDIHAQFTQKLDRAVAAVLQGEAHAAGVGDVVFGKLKGKMDLSSLRILSTSPATPNWIIVCRDTAMTSKVARALLQLKPGSGPAQSALKPSTFVGFQAIDIQSLDLLKIAVEAARRP